MARDNPLPPGNIHNLKPPGAGKITPDQAYEIYRSKEKGIDLAKRFGVAISTISDIKRAKSHSLDTGAFWSRSKRPQLTPAEAAAIFMSDRTTLELATEYRRAKNTIRKIRHGWGSVAKIKEYMTAQAAEAAEDVAR